MQLMHHRAALLLVFTIICLLTLLYFTHPLPQDPIYHVFADQREFLGIANFANVVSNLALILMSIAGIIALHKPMTIFQDRSERWLFLFFFIAVGLTGLG